MRLVDAHCHLESEEFAGALDAVLAQAREAGVVKCVTAAVAPDEWERSLALARAYPEIECALGLHPWRAHPAEAARLDDLGATARRGAIAIGEIGLDGKIHDPPLAAQTLCFEQQLIVAKELDLPVVLHCRGAFNEMLLVLRRIGAPRAGGVIHAFGGSVEWVEAFLPHRLSFSMGASLTYRNSAKRKEALRRIYPDHLLLETDSPDMPPVEVRERPNVPANIRFNLRAAAETLGLPEEDIAAQTTRNATRVFRLET